MFIDPHIGESINLDGNSYTFTEAQNAPGILYAEIGRKAKVYKLHSNNKVFALKAFKSGYRSAENVENIDRIAEHKNVLGLTVANRLAISPDRYPALIKEYAAFSYSILMPWIEGKSWSNYLTGKLLIGKQDSMQMAQALIKSMYELERRDLAHCDLSSSNFIFSLDRNHVELIDIEDMFGVGLKTPKIKPRGTGGYAPDWVKANGVWEAGADRYSTGILIGEILGWQFQDVRELRDGDAYFADGEFGNNSKRFRLLSERLQQIDAQISKLFKIVWNAESIEECPRIADWKQALESVRQPILDVSPDLLQFGTLDLTIKSPVQLQTTIKIKNNGGGLLVGEIKSIYPWVSVSPRDFSCLNDQISEHRIMLGLDIPRRKSQNAYNAQDLLSIKSEYGSRNLTGYYSVAFPEMRTPAWLYAIIIFAFLGVFALCTIMGTFVMVSSSQLLTQQPTQSISSDIQSASLQILYQDDFSDISSGWPVDSDADKSASYNNGQYLIQAITIKQDVWAHPGQNLGDVSISVDATKANGPDNNDFGIVCRFLDDDNFYFFVVSSDGYQAIGKYQNGTFSYLNSDTMQPTTAINAGYAVNQLRADCIGSTLTLYANGQLLSTATDSNFSTGDVGLLVGTFDDPNVGILFDNFVVTKP